MSFPATWRGGVTILAYKKGSNEKPKSFRLIILQVMLSKVFTAVIKNRLYNSV